MDRDFDGVSVSRWKPEIFEAEGCKVTTFPLKVEILLHGKLPISFNPTSNEQAKEWALLLNEAARHLNRIAGRTKRLTP